MKYFHEFFAKYFLCHFSRQIEVDSSGTVQNLCIFTNFFLRWKLVSFCHSCNTPDVLIRNVELRHTFEGFLCESQHRKVLGFVSVFRDTEC